MDSGFFGNGLIHSAVLLALEGNVLKVRPIFLHSDSLDLDMAEHDLLDPPWTYIAQTVRKGRYNSNHGYGQPMHWGAEQLGRLERSTC
jgi:hypothetical protein